ncbi:MAG: 4'-phosphopantetheinyl transferase superfamily protein [Alphaproteobacteria bacterium]|nr:4'-phosphopantetheinyl transferase superfamily protein [Alphaproteobacteria bacterium]
MKVFINDISRISDEQLSKATDFLSAEEKERLKNMISVKRQREFICGHFLLRKILSEELKMPTIEIKTLKSGALVLADTSLGYISLAHSFDKVAIAFCSNPVGIDVEKMRAKDNYNAILEQIDSVKDAQSLMQQGDSSQNAFFKLWTRREAFYKMSSVCEQSVLDKTFFYYFEQNDFMFCAASTVPQQIQWKNMKSIDKII